MSKSSYDWGTIDGCAMTWYWDTVWTLSIVRRKSNASGCEIALFLYLKMILWDTFSAQELRFVFVTQVHIDAGSADLSMSARKQSCVAGRKSNSINRWNAWQALSIRELVRCHAASRCSRFKQRQRQVSYLWDWVHGYQIVDDDLRKMFLW